MLPSLGSKPSSWFAYLGRTPGTKRQREAGGERFLCQGQLLPYIRYGQASETWLLSLLLARIQTQPVQKSYRVRKQLSCNGRSWPYNITQAYHCP